MPVVRVKDRRRRVCGNFKPVPGDAASVEGDSNDVDAEGTEGAGDIVEPANRVLPPTISGLPEGYVYGVTRYADVILQGILPDRLTELIHSLEIFAPTLDELRAGGGGRTVFVARFDQSLADQVDSETGSSVWGKKNLVVYRGAAFAGDPHRLVTTRGHEVDMFGVASLEPGKGLPGVAVEMEWNNKDPFYDRDLISFDALHREGAIAVGVIVTRGPGLQDVIGSSILAADGSLKFGTSTTHWNKLIPRVNLGGGGECPLLLVGIEAEKVLGIELAYQAKALRDEAKEAINPSTWRDRFDSYAEARAERARLKAEASALLPPMKETKDEE